MRLRFILLTLFLLGICSTLVAAPDDEYSPQGNHMTLGGAVSQARRDYNGRIISAETEKSGRHNIKILTDDGRVKRLHYNGGQGRNVYPPQKR
ncbi:MAG: hypothetical protein P8Y20_07320 [Gammaproteobacteria bacterium]|jgi:hypothetical protein